MANPNNGMNIGALIAQILDVDEHLGTVLVQWKGYTVDESTWEPLERVKLTDQFLQFKCARQVLDEANALDSTEKEKTPKKAKRVHAKRKEGKRASRSLFADVPHDVDSSVVSAMCASHPHS
jgi:hypothetical protein